MKIAVISDIHANLEALTTALSYIDSLNIKKIICLGDLVGYGPNPNECVELLTERNIPAVMGNHDYAVNNFSGRKYFNSLALTAIRWTDAALTNENKSFLNALPFTMDLLGQTFVHASPLQPEAFHYIFSLNEAVKNFHAFSTPICFIGHTHSPGIFCEDLVTKTVSHGKKFIVNVGSIGQPRSGDARLCFGIFETETFQFEFVKLPYDAETTQKKISAAGLPKQLGDRLLAGV
ncbi:MAG: metallophosphoesterase family protein [Bacteroidetes bacterium]|nr:metallophosphoesterase family protein [Bacteroidota bacterium]